jgi:hypothetical protein
MSVLHLKSKQTELQAELECCTTLCCIKKVSKGFFTIKGQWRSRYNRELYDLFKEPKLSITIRNGRLRWAGHVRRMNEEALPRRIMYVTPIGQRKTGRPKARWREEVGKVARMLGIRSWWSTAMNREERRRLLREARTFTKL